MNLNLLIFLYFLALSGDLLDFSVGPTSVKLSRFLAGILFCILLFTNRLRLIEKKLFVCFLWILSAVLLSALFSCHRGRTLAGCGAVLIAYAGFFLVPLNLMRLFDKEKILRLYFFSFFLVGAHALTQCILSLFDVREYFVSQYAGLTHIARGQSWSYEPSYYALFAIPFVAYFNARYLLLSTSLWAVIAANLLLLISTSTGAFFSYPFFFLSCLVLSFFPFARHYFPYLRRRLYQFYLSFILIFSVASICFVEVFLSTFFKFFDMGFLAHWSFVDRWEKIKDAWELFCLYPFFGCGLRAAEHYRYLKATYDRTDVAISQIENARDFYGDYTLSNVFTEILGTLGIFGLLAFTALLFFIWRLFTEILIDKRIASKERKTLFCLFLSIIVMLLCMQFNQELFRNYVWAHLGISLGYLLNVRSECQPA